MAYTPTSGTLGGVSIDSSVICAATWEWDGVINLINAPSFCSAPYMTRVAGLKDLTVTITGTWDSAANPFLIQGLKLGTVHNVILQINGTTIAQTPFAIVERFKIGDDVDGLCDISVTLKSNFSFTDFSGGLA